MQARFVNPQRKIVCRAPPLCKTEVSDKGTEKTVRKCDAVLVGIRGGKVSFDQACNVYDLDWMVSIREKGF